MAVPLVLIMLIVLGGALYAIHVSERAYRNHASRYRDGEFAYHAARGLIRFAEGRLEELLGGPPPPPGAGRDLHDFVIWTPGAELVGAEHSLQPPDPALFLPPGVTGDLELSVRFPIVRALGDPLPPGFARDPYEKRGTLELAAVVSVGGATRRISVRRPFQVLYRLPPALGRFALLLGGYEGGDEGLNRLDYSPRLGLFHDRVTGRPGWPLVVYPHPPGAEPGEPPATRYRADPLEPASAGGWIGLGGDQAWVMNLTFGAGDGSPFEEGHALRNFAAIHPSEAVPGAWERSRRMGLARSMADLPWLAPGEAASLPRGTSLLHLTGDARAPTPPVVLGRAYRRYLAFSKLAEEESGPYTSFRGLDEADFDQAGADFAAASGGAGYEQYRRLMLRVVTEPYNRSYDYLATSDERRLDDGTVEAGETPWRPRRLLGSEALAPRLEPAQGGTPEGYLYPSAEDLDATEAWGSLQLADEDGERLYRGTLDGLLQGVASRAEARAVWRVEAGPEEDAPAAFQRLFVEGEQLHLGTSCHLVDSTLTLGPLHVVAGGTIVVDGDVTVVGPITTAPGELLAVVSLDGDIRLAGEDPVVAGLVSCRGRFVPSRRGSDVRGLVAAARLDGASFAGTEGAHRLVYDPRWDPAIPAARFAQFRVHLGRARELVLRRR